MTGNLFFACVTKSLQPKASLLTVAGATMRVYPWHCQLGSPFSWKSRCLWSGGKSPQLQLDWGLLREAKQESTGC